MFGKRTWASFAALTAAALLAACSPAPEAPLAVVEAPAVVPNPGVDPEVLEAAIATIEEATGTELGLALFDGSSILTRGSIASLPAWSTIKIPISFAALRHCDYNEDYLEDLISAAIEISDNDATDLLWACLQEPGGAEMLVRREIGSRVDVAWGRTPWPFATQARYAWELSQRDDLEDNVIIGHMRHIDKEQTWGLGNLGIPFKGGWGDVDADGSWQSRQMGFGKLGGVTYGIAIGAVSKDGSFQATTDALDALAKVLASFNET
ncbi:hypothetical protein JZY91_11225 [Corynebacterium sp. CNCTC7651]|uniref:hypothetical protein n=1 Tax=Corynebacterium sp. CNCTC7651 TaxID=2815361 RepID=UPI001F31325F|nr:hypothetical protein [Corynebacterium sp. CNCTC7651]UIZ92191.1 hypothetical protein JZY91_11225 [Corynebacterium sp. CNCTC7651]